MKTGFDYLIDYVEYQQSLGQYWFTRQAAFAALKKSTAAFNIALHRLTQKGKIALIRSGFYMIIPLEYQVLGSLPASWFIGALMTHLKTNYYVALLNAASFYGATHQQAMTFQVIANRIMRSIQIGKVRIEFHYRQTIKPAFIRSFTTDTGVMHVSTPVVTICDLMKYTKASGHIHNFATVLVEMVDSFTMKELLHYIKHEAVSVAYAQRLGYLIEYLQLDKDIEPLLTWVNGHKLDYRPLVNDKHSKVIEKNKRWHLLINEHVEPDV